MAKGKDSANFILQDVTQSINAMDTDVGNRTAARDRAIIDPGPSVSGCQKGELRASEHRAPYLASRNSRSQSCGAVFEAKDLRNAQQDTGLASGLHHLPAFIR